MKRDAGSTVRVGMWRWEAGGEQEDSLSIIVRAFKYLGGR